MGRLWWFESGISCAYRDADGKPLYYDGYEAVKWESAKACGTTPTAINAMADAEGGCAHHSSHIITAAATANHSSRSRGSLCSIARNLQTVSANCSIGLMTVIAA